MGAVCEFCEGDMREVASCIEVPIQLVDGIYSPIPWGSESDDWGNGTCGDCGVQPGGFHHHGCDIEECPRCHGQVLSCDCGAPE